MVAAPSRLFVATLSAASLVVAIARGEPPKESEGKAEEDANPMLAAHADDVTLDPRQRSLGLRGHVQIDAIPFHLQSDALDLLQTPRGVRVTGEGRVGFCACLGTPLAVPFHDALVAPPGDLVLYAPRLEVYGVPILAAPVFWLRSTARPGVLPPDIAYRGVDGLFLGDGVHLPWAIERRGTGASAYEVAHASLDVREGVYLKGGSASEAELHTDRTEARVRFDRAGGADGFLVDARGAVGAPEEGAAWDVDALRGSRSVHATTDLDAASRTSDRAEAGMGVGGSGWVLGAGASATAARGGPLAAWGAAGPFLHVASSGALGPRAFYNLLLGGGSLTEAGLSSLAYGTAKGDVGVRGRGGPFALAGDFEGSAGGFEGGLGPPGTPRDPVGYTAASARSSVGLPLFRSYGSTLPSDPWVHRVEPKVEMRALARRDDLPASGVSVPLPTSAGAGLAGSAALAEVKLESALGRWGAREAWTVMVAGGGTLGDTSLPVPVGRWRTDATFRALSVIAEGAHVLPDRPSNGRVGHVVLAHVRLGSAAGANLGVFFAGRYGVDPLRARLLGDAPIEPGVAFLRVPGSTGGVKGRVPLSSSVALATEVDGDLDQRLLLAATGAIEWRDRCRCLALRTFAAHRLGRDGVDVGVSLDLAPSAPRGATP